MHKSSISTTWRCRCPKTCRIWLPAMQPVGAPGDMQMRKTFTATLHSGSAVRTRASFQPTNHALLHAKEHVDRFVPRPCHNSEDSKFGSRDTATFHPPGFLRSRRGALFPMRHLIAMAVLPRDFAPLYLG